MNSFSIDRVANAFNRSSDIVLRKKVLIRFNVEKHRSHSLVDIGVVQIILTSKYVSERKFVKLFAQMKERSGNWQNTSNARHVFWGVYGPDYLA